MKFDLGVFENQTFDLTLGSEVICSIKKPTKKMLIQLTSSEAIIQNSTLPLVDRMEAMDSLTLVLFNHNAEDKKFSREDVEKYDFQAQLQIYKAYFSWCYSPGVSPN